MSNVSVCLDERARLVMALLAASDWPDQEQAGLRHAVHPQAKVTRQQVAALAQHPAVTTVNDLLARQTPVDLFFTAVLRAHWPQLNPSEPLPQPLANGWLPQVVDFCQCADLTGPLWAGQSVAWEEALADLQAIFANNHLARFLARLQGRAPQADIVIVPNLVYPALTPVLAETTTALYLILPPPKAYGESRPWPYREGVDWVLSASVRCLAAHNLPVALCQLDAGQQALWLHAAAVLFLEEALGEAESLSYLVRSKKQLQLPQLPTAVAQLRGQMANDE